MNAGEIILFAGILFSGLASALFFAASVWYEAQGHLAYYEADARIPWYVKLSERLLGR